MYGKAGDNRRGSLAPLKNQIGRENRAKMDAVVLVLE